MRLNSVIISSFFVSVVLAARGRERRLSGVDILPGSYSSGATLILIDGGAIQSIAGTIRVPDIARQQPGSSVAAIVAIDHLDSSCNNTLQLGVVFNLVSEGKLIYTVVYGYPSRPRLFPAMDVNAEGIDIKAGDDIKLIAYANLMQGFVTVVNLSNNQLNVTYPFNLTESLCGKTASWFVEVSDASVNLGTLVFANAEVGGRDFNHVEVNLLDIYTQDGKPLTSVSTDNHSVTVQWL